MPPLDLAGQAGAGCGKAGMGFQTDGFCDDFHGFPGDAEDVSALPIPIVLPREVILGKEWKGKLWFSRAQRRDLGNPATSAFPEDQPHLT